MSFTSSIHSRLKEYIQAVKESERQKIFEELIRTLPSPQFVTDCDFIPQDHKLKQEAWIVFDAFEAVTNGMFSFELSRQLDEIEGRSLMYPWAVLTKAVEAFYQGDPEKSYSLLGTLPETAAPYVFREFFITLLEKGSTPEVWEKLKKTVLDDSKELHSSLEQLIEAAQAGMEDLMLETAGMIIRDIRKDHPEKAAEILIWTFQKLQESDILPDKAAHKAQQLFGETEGLRLTALATLSYDQDRSLIYWLLSLQSYLKSRETLKSDVKAYLRIIRDVAETVTLEFELTEEYLSLLGTHAKSLINSLNHLYPEVTEGIRYDSLDRTSEIIPLLQGLAGDEPAQPQPVHKKTMQNSTAPVQLELFAF